MIGDIIAYIFFGFVVGALARFVLPGRRPMGCLATHIAWNHPRTAHLTVEAGISWLNHVAGLNPGTSHVIREWDSRGPHDWEIRAELLALVREEQQARSQPTARPARHSRPLVEV